jgi:type IV pilus assembly protein PilX
VVLIVALVILVIVTLLGVMVMKGAALDLKMAKNSQERQEAFNAAEAALSQGEAHLMTGNFANTDLIPGCSGAKCFNTTCSNGYCFAGTYAGSSQAGCSVVPTTGPNTGVVPADPWSSSTLSVWTTAARNRGAIVTGALSAKYIIEFRCFIDGDSGTVASNAGDALFRVTARGKSIAGNVEVMLQSTFRLKAP